MRPPTLIFGSLAGSYTISPRDRRILSEFPGKDFAGSCFLDNNTSIGWEIE